MSDAFKPIREYIEQLFTHINEIGAVVNEINQKFVSGNSVPVTSVMVTKKEWDVIVKAMDDIKEMA